MQNTTECPVDSWVGWQALIHEVLHYKPGLPLAYWHTEELSRVVSPLWAPWPDTPLTSWDHKWQVGQKHLKLDFSWSESEIVRPVWLTILSSGHQDPSLSQWHHCNILYRSVHNPPPSSISWYKLSCLFDHLKGDHITTTLIPYPTLKTSFLSTYLLLRCRKTGSGHSLNPVCFMKSTGFPIFLIKFPLQIQTLVAVHPPSAGLFANVLDKLGNVKSHFGIIWFPYL